MQYGQSIEVRLHGDDRWYSGVVLNARKQWVQLADYGREMIADESNIEEWRPLTVSGATNE